MGGEGPNWNPNQEENPEQNQEQTHEQHQNRGAEVLSEISFADAKREGEVPEGVRDEQDYREYQQEKDAKLNEARNFVLENYSNEKMSSIDSEYTERIKEFANSEELKTIVENGFSLEELYENGLISKHGEGYTESRFHIYPHVAQSMALKDAEDIVKDLAKFCDHHGKHLPEDINKMHDVFKSWKENDLDPEQYIFIRQATYHHSNMYHRLMFGDSMGENMVNSYEEHTTKLLQELPEIAKTVGARYGNGNVGAKILVEAYNEMEASKRYVDINKDVRDRIRDKFGESADKMVQAIIDELGDNYYFDPGVKEMKDIIKGVLSPYDDAIKVAKNATLRDVDQETFEEIEIPAFSYEELIGAMYSLKNSGEIEKFGEGWRDIDYKLGRNIGRLEKLGFSRESLLKIMRKNDVHVGTEEIEDMREDGLNDTEIAYAANACKWGFCSPNGERHWVNEDFKVFSDTDLLNAVLMANFDKD